jgi:hypothetical protein
LQLVLSDPSSWVCVLWFVLLIFHYYIWFDSTLHAKGSSGLLITTNHILDYFCY